MAVLLRPEIAALTPHRQGRAAPEGAFKLSSNENPAPTHPAVLEAVRSTEPNRYPDNAMTALRERLATRIGVSADEVHASGGSVALLNEFIRAAAGRGDEVVYPWRSFEVYPGIVTAAGATGVPVPLREDGRHDLDAMAGAVTDRTRAVVVCTPNNPTSAVVTEAEFRALLDRVPPTVLVLLDEAYREFVDDPRAVDGIPLLEAHPNVVVLRTFSKAYALAGLRVGYAVGAPVLLDAARAVQVTFAITDAGQRAAIAALEHEDEILVGVREIVERRGRVLAALRDQGWRIPEPQGNFVWLPTGELTTAAEETLERHGIVARPFPPDGIRVTIGEEDAVEPLLAATAEVVATLPSRA